METLTPTLDTVSVCFGIFALLITFLFSAITDLILSLSRWLYEKAVQLRNERLGDQPSLIDRIRKKFFPPDDAA